jgi:uncharacterized RDD family membrane protein YckC
MSAIKRSVPVAPNAVPLAKPAARPQLRIVPPPAAAPARMATGEVEDGPTAPPFERLLARLVDVGGLTVAFFLIAFASGFWLGITGGASEDPEIRHAQATALGFKAIIATIVLYNILPMFLYGQTAGMKLMGLKLVRLEGGRVDPVSLLLRETLGKFLSMMFFSAGNLLAFVRPDQRALHDLMFGTKVIKLPKS